MSEQTVKLPQEGERLGSGIVLSLISTGGSAYVYKTWAEAMEIHRAVKVMAPDAEPDVRDRFSTEARINSKLIHPNIVHCYNFGQTAGGLPYLEMEYISGPSLASVISKRGALPVPVALVVTLGLLDALTYAHTVKYTLYDKQHVGIIHRDLKPANIIINGEGIPKLMDFGIARPVDFSIHTVAGTVPGTIAYMSPEACAGGDLDFRSDIFQVGICLYEMLSGVPAFPQTDLTSLLAAKGEGKVQPLEALVRGLSLPVLSFVRKCLALNPADRFESAQTCLTALRALLTPAEIASSEETIQAFLEGRKPASTDGTNLPGKSRVRFVMALAAGLLIIAGAAFFLISSGLLSPSRLPVQVSTPVIPASLPVQAPAPVLNPSVSPLTDPSAVRSAGTSRVPDKVSRSSSPAAPKTLLKAQDTAVKAVPPQDLALAALEEGRGLLTSGRLNDALASFQKALRLPTQRPRQEIVRQCVYGSAQCNSALYSRGEVPVSNLKAAWQSVLNTFPAASPEYSEASARLKEIR